MKILIIVIVVAAIFTWIQRKIWTRPNREHQAYLMQALGILMRYRENLPEEPQPLDEAMLRIIKVLEDGGMLLQERECSCPRCTAGQEKQHVDDPIS